jgi:hypothetical protein
MNLSANGQGGKAVLTKGHQNAKACSYAARWGAIRPEVGETERLQGFRRDPLRVKIREMGRGLSLADTQTGR